MLLPCGNNYLRKLSVQSVQSVFALKVFALPAEFFLNTDYKDFHRCYCFDKFIRSFLYIRVRFTNRAFRTRIIRIFTDIIAL